MCKVTAIKVISGYTVHNILFISASLLWLTYISCFSQIGAFLKLCNFGAVYAQLAHISTPN